MEHLVRVQNERDRRTLAWLREQVGDAAIAAAAQRYGGSKPYLSAVCRTLGVKAPQFSAPRHITPSAVAEQSLATIRHVLASRTGHPRSALVQVRRG
ncbi:hypothetical protein [Paraburkholderia phenoliruptrix]|uniref:Uncharacterized protein n=2 Tax=Paraburkholderia phenoliruptrix TaxID=252970 RepID=K0DYW3_9BURK|nr:hypothetical protein [Paraburkholderia phenoliruptrix]AFT90135.1 hypothetical protein BUPH_04564 [Paraburkholderia phenoliruptrix BR3459a]CAB4052775.1 hypothetical protein LMG9964_06465 [Paraburkholderia phenoliruptrix]